MINAGVAGFLRPQALRPVFFYPSLTQPISTTGDFCALGCAHCRGHFLQNMLPLERLNLEQETAVKSILLSGGCDIEGKVILPEEEKLACLSQRFKLNIHAGLVSQREAELICRYAHTVSQDLHGDDMVIKKVLGLDNTVYDYQKSYLLLRERCKVVPHLLIGLGENFQGELEIAEFLKENPPAALVLLIYIPISRNELPPDREKVLSLMENLRKKLDRVPLILGCMRPGGTYREIIDKGVLEIGFQGIVKPVVTTENPLISRECCALWNW